MKESGKLEYQLKQGTQGKDQVEKDNGKKRGLAVS